MRTPSPGGGARTDDSPWGAGAQGGRGSRAGALEEDSPPRSAKSSRVRTPLNWTNTEVVSSENGDRPSASSSRRGEAGGRRGGRGSSGGREYRGGAGAAARNSSNPDEFWNDVGEEGWSRTSSHDEDDALSPLLDTRRELEAGRGPERALRLASENASSSWETRTQRTIACWAVVLVLIVGAPLLAVDLCPSLVQRAANSATLSLSALNISLPNDSSTPLAGPSQPQVIHLSADFALSSLPLRLFPLPVLLTRASLSLEFVPPEPSQPTLARPGADVRQDDGALGRRGVGGGGEGACVVGHTTLGRMSLGGGAAQRVDSDVLLEDGADGCFARLAAAVSGFRV